MFEWFSEIFSSNSEKARFVSIVFTASVAILILLGNQYFIDRRERRKLIIEKIESIYKLSLDFETNAEKYIFCDLDNNSDEYINSAAESLDSMNMLFNLYFQNDDFKKEKYFSQLHHIKSLLAPIDDTDHEVKTQMISKAKQELKVLCDQLKDKCRKLMRSHGYKFT